MMSTEEKNLTRAAINVAFSTAVAGLYVVLATASDDDKEAGDRFRKGLLRHAAVLRLALTELETVGS